MAQNHHYIDHAANERTFLAWIRTALSIIAIALVLGKLDIEGQTGPAELLLTGASAVMGVLVVLGATFKYLRIRARIIAGEEPDHGVPLLDIALASAIIAIIVALAATRFV